VVDLHPTHIIAVVVAARPGPKAHRRPLSILPRGDGSCSRCTISLQSTIIAAAIPGAGILTTTCAHLAAVLVHVQLMNYIFAAVRGAAAANVLVRLVHWSVVHNAQQEPLHPLDDRLVARRMARSCAAIQGLPSSRPPRRLTALQWLRGGCLSRLAPLSPVCVCVHFALQTTASQGRLKSQIFKSGLFPQFWNYRSRQGWARTPFSSEKGGSSSQERSEVISYGILKKCFYNKNWTKLH